MITLLKKIVGNFFLIIAVSLLFFGCTPPETVPRGDDYQSSLAPDFADLLVSKQNFKRDFNYIKQFSDIQSALIYLRSSQNNSFFEGKHVRILLGEELHLLRSTINIEMEDVDHGKRNLYMLPESCAKLTYDKCLQNAANRKKPIIRGSFALSGHWEKSLGTPKLVYRNISEPNSEMINVLYNSNGDILTRSREPDLGSYHYTKNPRKFSFNTCDYKKDSCEENVFFKNHFYLDGSVDYIQDYNLSEIEVVIHQVFRTPRLKIKSVEQKNMPLKDGRTIETIELETVGLPQRAFDSWLSDKMPGYRVYFDNVGIPNSPGEWYYDASIKKIYYYLKDSENLVENNIVDEKGAEIKLFAPYDFSGSKPFLQIGSNDQRIFNVIIAGLSFQYSNWTTKDLPIPYNYIGAQAHSPPNSRNKEFLRPIINLSCHGCIIEDNDFLGVAGHGIRLYGGYFKSNRISKNKFLNIGGSAIVIGDRFEIGDPDKPPLPIITGNNDISSNTIRNLGFLHGESPAILSFLSDGNIIKNNELYNLAYSGISVGWDWVGAHDGKKEKGNIIQFNKIDDSLKLMDDGGAIYLVGDLGKTDVKNNDISNVSGFNLNTHTKKVATAGIYLDRGAKNIRIESNQIKHFDLYGIKSANSINLTIADNFIYKSNDIPGACIKIQQALSKEDLGNNIRLRKNRLRISDNESLFYNINQISGAFVNMLEYNTYTCESGNCEQSSLEEIISQPWNSIPLESREVGSTYLNKN